MKEIEILVELYTDIDECKKKLASFEFNGIKKTTDIYYYDPLRDNLKPNKDNELNECLRIRTKGDKSYITYKVDHFDDNNIWLYSDEYETEVKDLIQIKNIINLLGLKELLVIDNNKTIYKTEKYEIALEEVENLGNFMEVEYCTNDDVDVITIKREIQDFIDGLGFEVSGELNMGKPEMMLRKSMQKSVEEVN